MEVAALLEDPPCLRSHPSHEYPPFTSLIGEHPLLISKTVDGSVMVTNFRFCVCEKKSINIPLMMVGDLLVSEAAKRLRIGCKDGSTYSCTFATTEDCQSCMAILREKTGLPQSSSDLFAYRFYDSAVRKQGLRPNLTSAEEENVSLCQPVNPAFAYSFDKETERLQFDTSKQGPWRKSHANKNYEFCPTYPKFHLLPAAVDDDRLKVSLDFRALKRFPSVVWRDKRTGMVLIRSSQPLSSFLGVSYFTNHADVSLIEEIVNACNRDWHKSRHSLLGAEANKGCDCDGAAGVSSVGDGLKEAVAQESLLWESSSVSRGHSPINGGFDSGDGYIAKKLAIVDCRSLAGVWGNSFKGGGTEDEAIYKCSTVHLDLANIHNVRDSFNKLRILCHAYVEGTFLKSLSSCMWLSYISALLRGANIVVELMHVMKRPVLVHCSDGWDRTSQIVSLSELMMDSYYRTLEGFQVLVEREWLHFGHKFGERGGHDPNCSDTNQISPIFLQFLDCVHQLTVQYPAKFQFNEAYLVKLLQHSYACLFGNFLHNCQRERDGCQEKTASVWALLHPENRQFVNALYKPSDQVLKAKFSEPDIVLWKSVYMGSHINQTDFVRESSPAAAGARSKVATSEEAPRSKSLDALSKVIISGGHQNIIQVDAIASAASAAADLSTHHVCNKSSSTELLHAHGEAPQAHGRTSPSGAPENCPDSSGRMSPGVSASTEHGPNQVLPTSHNGDSPLEAALTEGITKSSIPATLADSPGEAPPGSAEQQICLNPHGDVPLSESGVAENRDAFLAVHPVDQSLVTSSECGQETEVCGRCDARAPCGYQTGCCDVQTGCCDQHLASTDNVIDKTGIVEAGLVNPDYFEAGLVNTDSCQAGLVNPDYFEAGLVNTDSCQAGLVNPDNFQAGLVNTDNSESGLANLDNSEAGLANPDNSEAVSVNPDYFEAGLVNTDNFQAGLVNPDNFQAGLVNTDNSDAGFANPDNSEAGLANPDNSEAVSVNPDYFEAGLVNTDNFQAGLVNPDNFQAGLVNPDNFQAGLVNTDNSDAGLANPDNSEAGLANPDNSEAVSVNPDYFEAGLVNTDNFQAGLVNTDNSESGLANLDNSEAGLANPDNSEAGLVNTDNFQAGLVNPDNFQAGLVNTDNFQAGLVNLDNFQAGLVNTDNSETGLVNPDNFHTGLVNTDNYEAGLVNPDNFQAGLVTTDNSEAGLVNPYNSEAGLANPDNFDTGNVNSNIDNPGSVEIGKINSNTDSIDAGDTDSSTDKWDGANADVTGSNIDNIGSRKAVTTNSNEGSHEVGNVPDSSDAGNTNSNFHDTDKFEVEKTENASGEDDSPGSSAIMDSNTESTDGGEAENTNRNTENLERLEASNVNSNIDNLDHFEAEISNVDSADSLEAGNADIDSPSSFEAGNTDIDNPDSLEAGNADIDNPDTFEAGNTDIDNPSSFEAGNTDIDNPDSFEAGNTDIDNPNTFEAGNTDIDNPSSIEAVNSDNDNPDCFEAGNTDIDNPDSFEAGNADIDNPDSFEAGNADIDNPDSFEAGNTDIDNPNCFEAVNSDIDNPDCFEAVNTDIDNPDSFEAGNADIYNPDSYEAGNADIYNPDSFEAGNTNIDSPGSFEAGTTNVDNPDTFEAGNTNVDRPDSCEAGNTNRDIASFDRSEVLTINIASHESFQAETLSSSSMDMMSFQTGQVKGGHVVSNSSAFSAISVLDLSQHISVNGSATSGYVSEKASLSSDTSSLSGETDEALNDVFENASTAGKNCLMKHNKCESGPIRHDCCEDSQMSHDCCENSEMRNNSRENSQIIHNCCENSQMRHNNCDNSRCFVKSSDINNSASVEDIIPRKDSQRPTVNSTNFWGCCNGVNNEIRGGMVKTNNYNSDPFLFNSLESVEISNLSRSRTCAGCSVLVDALIDEAEVRISMSSSTSCCTKPLEVATRHERLTSAIPHAFSSPVLALHVSPKKRDSHPSEMNEGCYESKMLSRLSGTAVGASQVLSVSPACLCRRAGAGLQHRPSGSEVVSRRLLRATVATSTTDISDSSIGQPSASLLTTTAVKHQPRLKKHIDVDGLTLFCDERQDLVAELLYEKDCKIQDLQRHLNHAQKQIVMLRRYSCQHRQGSLCDHCTADSSGGEWSSLGPMSDSASDASWETVDESVSRMLPWVPPHVAMTHCAGCAAQFGVTRWKHHCRSCGQFVCTDCSAVLAQVAEFNKPERVCRRCHSQLLQLSPGASSDGRIPTLVADD